VADLGLLDSPIVWLGAMVLAGWLLYLWSARTAPPFRPTGMKAKAYTGGEAIPGQVYRPSYEFFHVALFFTLMHVAAIVVATAPRDIVPWGTIIYLMLIGFSVIVLRWTR